MKNKNEKNENVEIKKTKTYAFWMSVLSASLLVIVQILSVFGINIKTQGITEIISGILGVLVVAGILIGPIKEHDEEEKQDDEGDENG